jgi:predicted Fe-S protein YdhL (DUF1289 family)
MMPPENSSQDAVESPCIDVCAVNPNGICLGCYRSLDEIACWSSVTDETRREIKRSAEKRKIEAAED